MQWYLSAGWSILFRRACLPMVERPLQLEPHKQHQQQQQQQNDEPVRKRARLYRHVRVVHARRRASALLCPMRYCLSGLDSSPLCAAALGGHSSEHSCCMSASLRWTLCVYESVRRRALGEPVSAQTARRRSASAITNCCAQSCATISHLYGR